MNHSLDNAASPAKQFSLLTLVVIFLGVAVALAYTVNVPAIPGQPNPTDSTWKFVFKLQTFVTVFCCVVGLVLVLNHWTKAKQFAVHPGHLFTLASGIGFLAYRAVDQWYTMHFLNLESLQQEPTWDLLRQWRYTSIGVMGFSALLLSIGLFRYSWHWRTVFGLAFFQHIAIVYSIWLFLQHANPAKTVEHQQLVLVNSIVTYSYFAVGIGILIACVIDRLRKHKRDRLHWFGLTIWLLITLLPIILLKIGLRYLSPSDLIGI